MVVSYLDLIQSASHRCEPGEVHRPRLVALCGSCSCAESRHLIALRYQRPAWMDAAEVPCVDRAYQTRDRFRVASCPYSTTAEKFYEFLERQKPVAVNGVDVLPILTGVVFRSENFPVEF